MKKNITFAIDEDLLNKIRVVAAERRTSVNALVRDHLKSLVANRYEVDEAREALMNLAHEKAGDMGCQKWDRSNIYDR